MKRARYSHRDESRVAPLARLVEKLSRWALTSNRLGSGLEGLGSIRVPRVVFGVSPNTAFRRDAGNGTRGRVRSPEVPTRAGISAFFSSH